MSVVNALVVQVLAGFLITPQWSTSAPYVPVKDSAMVAAPTRE